MLSDKIYTQVERITDMLCEGDISGDYWEYVSILKDLQKVYLLAKEDEALHANYKEEKQE